jgi:hypothetical protein
MPVRPALTVLVGNKTAPGELIGSHRATPAPSYETSPRNPIIS